MSEPSTENTDAPEAPEAQTEQGNPAEDALGDAGKQALDRMKRDKRAAEKRASDLESRLKEFEDRDKTEAQKLAERADAAERRAVEAEASLARFQVALEEGLTPSQAKRLVGTTVEELRADAQELKADLAAASQPRAPRPDPSQGRDPGRPDPGPGFARLVDAYATSSTK
jgi:hypothetical protein